MTNLRELFRALDPDLDLSTLTIYPPSLDLDRKFDGYTKHPEPFTAWDETLVYFLATYDGNFWIMFVPRNPCEEATYPVGE